MLRFLTADVMAMKQQGVGQSGTHCQALGGSLIDSYSPSFSPFDILERTSHQH